MTRVPRKDPAGLSECERSTAKVNDRICRQYVERSRYQRVKSKAIEREDCNATDKKHRAYNGRAALYKLRTISQRQHPGKTPWADATKLGPAKSLNLLFCLFQAAWGVGGWFREAPCCLPVFTEPFSSLGLAHPWHWHTVSTWLGVCLCVGLRLYVCVRAGGGGGWRIGRWMTGASERDHSR